MEAPLKTLTLLYTARLRGDLESLPRLSAFLRRLRGEFRAETTLLLDLGEACASGVWHCDVTEGRSMLLGLDGMGYDAARVTGYLSAAARAKLATMGEILHLRLLEADQTCDHAGLCIDPVPGEATLLEEGGRLRLTTVEALEVGVAHLNADAKGWRLASSGVYRLPPGTPPDPTIAGLIDFILAEAEQTRRKRGGAG
ncbi:MAG: hypothetical protein L6Q98_05305 [Anaerolineae bacterium]|nr:hypothetical protein [Anaerolineae bacterium]NUQ03647.1 hypothetical protein [Anaerolineae bacterium]